MSICRVPWIDTSRCINDQFEYFYMKILMVKDMKMIMRSLFFVLAMVSATGLVAMDQDSGMTPDEKNACRAVIQGNLLSSSVEDIIKQHSLGQMRVQFGYNLLDPEAQHKIISFCTDRPGNEKVPQREKDIIHVLNQCLANDLHALLETDHTDQATRQKLKKYECIPVGSSPFTGANATEAIVTMLSIKNGIGTGVFLSAILAFRPAGPVAPVIMKFLFCGSIIGIAVLCGIYYAFFTKKTAEETEDEESENDEKQDQMQEVINEQV